MKKGVIILASVLLSGIALGQETPPIETNQQTPPPPPPPSVVVEDDGESDVEIRRDIIEFPDVDARFRGGEKGMQRYVAKKVEYPMEAIEKNITGRVYLSFVVTKRGRVKDVEVERGVHPSLDEAARKVVEDMPRWKPAKHKGRKVNSRCRLPIIFTLE